MSPKKGSSGGGDGSGHTSNGSVNHFFDATITLEGSHFHKPLPTATLVVSSICLLSFVGILVWYAWIKGKNNQTQKLLHWAVFGVSTLFMILYFGLDVADRILHELKLKVSSMYINIGIPLETFTLFADLMLLTTLLLPLAQSLLDHAGVATQHSTFLRLGHKGLLAILLVLFIADRASFIYRSLSDSYYYAGNVVAAAQTVSQFGMVRGPYAKLNTAFFGLYLAGAVSFCAITFSVLLKLQKTRVLHRTFLIFLPLLSVSLVVRTIVNFVYALIFKLFRHRLYFGAALVHVTFYGFLSVAIYMSVLKVAGTEEDWDSTTNTEQNNVEYGFVNEANFPGLAAEATKPAECEDSRY